MYLGMNPDMKMQNQLVSFMKKLRAYLGLLFVSTNAIVAFIHTQGYFLF